jgi:hypothetical protein
MALLVTVAAGHGRHVSRLVTFFGNVSLLTAVAAGPAAALRAILGKMSNYNY